MKKIPFKSYIKVFLLFVFTIVLCIILSNNYKNKKAYERTQGHLQSFLSNVKYDELQNYLIENHDGYIYIAPSGDTTLEIFENELKKFIIEEDLEKEFVYLDSNSFDNIAYQEIAQNFSDEMHKRGISIPNCPNIYFVKDGKIADILFTDNNSITLESVQNFIHQHQEEI